MVKNDLLSFIPYELTATLSSEILVEHALLYYGRESLQMLSAIWNFSDTSLSRTGVASDSVETRLALVSEAQECREKSEYLSNLAIRAESKPQLFRRAPYLVNDRVTCYFDELPSPARKFARNRHFVDAVVTRVIDGNGKHPSYRLNFRSKNGEISPVQFLLAPDRISVYPRNDFPYFRLHPNFFRLYLELHAQTDLEHEKINRILAAL